MPIRPRYKLFSSRPDEGGRIEIEDLRGVTESDAGYIDFSAYLQGGNDEDGGASIELALEDVIELRDVLNSIIQAE